jgi:F-type H+-transporting ATPase subunit b
VTILNTLLFKPLLNVISERKKAVLSARAMAEKATADAAAALQTYDLKTQAARAEVHKAMDEVRRLADARRAQLLEATRADAESQLAVARAKLAADMEAAHARLATEADSLGEAIVSRVLGTTAR